MSRRYTIAELSEQLERAEQEIPTGSTWRHYRDNAGEKPYAVTGHAITESDEALVVLYRNGEGVTFSRPLTEFIETVRGGTQKRFQKIS